MKLNLLLLEYHPLFLKKFDEHEYSHIYYIQTQLNQIWNILLSYERTWICNFAFSDRRTWCFDLIRSYFSKPRSPINNVLWLLIFVAVHGLNFKACPKYCPVGSNSDKIVPLRQSTLPWKIKYSSTYDILDVKCLKKKQY